MTAASLQEQALDLIDGYVDPGRIVRRTDSLLKSNTAKSTEIRAAHVEFEELVKFSDDYDEIFAAALAAAETERIFAATQRIATELASQKAEHRRRTHFYSTSATAPALNFLNEQLLQLMYVVREHGENLGNIISAAQALRSGQKAQAAWVALEDAVGVYEEIRRVQRILTVALTTDAVDTVEPLDRSGHLRNSFDLERYWHHNRRLAYRAGSRGIFGEQPWIEWVRDNPPKTQYERDGGNTWPAGEPSAYLRWLADGDKPWVPDVDTLLRVDELAERMRELPSSPQHLRTLAETREQYYTARGLAPVVPYATERVTA